MTEENKKRQENETIKDWLNRVSIKDDTWIKKARRRQKYDLFYGFVFKLRVRYYSIKKKYTPF